MRGTDGNSAERQHGGWGRNMEQERKESRKEENGTRKPYTKPGFVSEKIYETLALGCGKLPGQGGFCNAAPRRS